MSKIEESVTDNCHFQRKGNVNQYTHSVKAMSKLKDASSILENSAYEHTEDRRSKGENITGILHSLNLNKPEACINLTLIKASIKEIVANLTCIHRTPLSE